MPDHMKLIMMIPKIYLIGHQEPQI